MSYIEKFWRPATDKDVLRVMKGDEVEARFRDEVGERWVGGSRLGGWVKDNRYPWLDESRSGWTHCQVYDPDQWYLDKPEPGEGYRLLGKFPDEPVQGGDFAFDRSMGWIELRGGCNPAQGQGIWYRRRIEQPKPEPKHYVLQVGDTCDVPSGHRITVTEHGVEVT